MKVISPKLCMLIACLTISLDTVQASDCARSSHCDEYWESSAVFVGKVISVAPGRKRSVKNSLLQPLPGRFYEIRFSVEKSYKGYGGARQSVYVLNSTGERGYEFKRGERYLVFAHGAGLKGGLPLILNECSKSNLASNASQEITRLDELLTPGSIADELRSVVGGLLSGKALSKPQPGYPDAAKVARVSGPVTVAVILNESGEVIRAEAVCGHPMLYEASVSAARRVRYSPTLIRGKPVKFGGLIIYNFTPN
jgi:TonB family protein